MINNKRLPSRDDLRHLLQAPPPDPDGQLQAHVGAGWPAARRCSCSCLCTDATIYECRLHMLIRKAVYTVSCLDPGLLLRPL